MPTVKSSPGLAAKLKPKPSAKIPHAVVIARAGTGKTTTLVEGLKVLRGQSVPFDPSPQQHAIWDALKRSSDARNICFVAFNTSIANELKTKVPSDCSAMTMHSMGAKVVRRAYDNPRFDEYKTSNLLGYVTNKDIRELRRFRPDFVKAACELTDKCKMHLIDGEDDEALLYLAAEYDIDLNGSQSEIISLVPEMLEKAKDVAVHGFDFGDMIWLPIVNDLQVFKYDLLLVDEAQDLNHCQQALARLAGDRLFLCGDPKQSIYGFAGADPESMPRMIDLLSATDRGCETYPLTVTRRCGKAIVKEAQRIVPDFEAFETNPAGIVTESTLPVYDSQVRDGDMILCRVNAPLVSQCFRFLKAGRRAYIQGRDIARGLVSTVNKMKASSVNELLQKLDDWQDREIMKEQAKRNPSENRIITVQDRYMCLVAFTDGCATVADVLAKIEQVFSDEKGTKGIRLSSIHRAKGLEAHRVFFLRLKKAQCPHPMAKTPVEKEQEQNLLYVAITRAIDELTYVSDGPEEK